LAKQNPFCSFEGLSKLKKVFSILLLAIFLFNLGGYYILFWALKAQANREFSALLNEGHYDESKTFEVKIPLSLPYPLQSNGFERQSGQFEYRGEHYQVVKQKYENDILTIVCLKDTKANRLAKVKDAFSETSSTQPVKDGALNIPIKVLQEFVTSFSEQLSGIAGWSQSIEHTPYFDNHNGFFLTKHSPPPRA
jgi:cbb3-type cytochrome oxidase subunit 3